MVFRLCIICAIIGLSIFNFCTFSAISIHGGFNPFRDYLSELGYGGGSAAWFNFAIIAGGLLLLPLFNVLPVWLESPNGITKTGVLGNVACFSLIGMGVYTLEDPVNHGILELTFWLSIFVLIFLTANRFLEIGKHTYSLWGYAILGAILIMAATENPAWSQKLSVAGIEVWAVSLIFYFLTHTEPEELIEDDSDLRCRNKSGNRKAGKSFSRWHRKSPAIRWLERAGILKRRDTVGWTAYVNRGGVLRSEFNLVRLYRAGNRV